MELVKKIIIIDGPVYDSINKDIVKIISNIVTDRIVKEADVESGICSAQVPNLFEILMDGNHPLLKLSVEETVNNIKKLKNDPFFDKYPIVIIGGYISAMTEYIVKRFPINSKIDKDEYRYNIKLVCDSYKECYELLKPDQNLLLYEGVDSVLNKYFGSILSAADEGDGTVVTGWMADFIKSTLRNILDVQIDVMNTVNRVYLKANVGVIDGSGTNEETADRIWNAINPLFNN